MRRAFTPLLLATLAGCVTVVDTPPGAGSTSSAGTTRGEYGGVASTRGDDRSTSTGSPTSSDTTGSIGGEESSDDGADTITFIDGDVPGVCGQLPPRLSAHCSECDLWTQDCGDGDGCKPWANDGGDEWNAVRCEPLSERPDALGEPCTVEGADVSGVDSCDEGTMCWSVGEDGVGVCAAFCDPWAGDRSCAESDTACVIANYGVLPLCLPTCNPLEPSCDADQGCYPGTDQTFVCIDENTEHWTEPGVFHSFCPPGSFALGPSEEKGCVEDEPCCAAFCDLNAADGCEPEETCVPYFDDLTEVGASLHAVGQCVASE